MSDTPRTDGAVMIVECAGRKGQGGLVGASNQPRECASRCGCDRDQRPESFLYFDGMGWPNPERTAQLEYRLRYGPGLTRGDQLVAASVMAAYRQLIELPRDSRQEVIKGIRAALAVIDKEGEGE